MNDEKDETDLCGTGGTMPVGSKPLGVSPYGVHDMTGNVWEWVVDSYSANYYSESTDTVNPIDNGSRRVKKGGSWSDKRKVVMRSSYRGFNQNNSIPRHNNVGFRCARTSHLDE